MRENRIILGVALILIGLLALLSTLGSGWASMERLWPLVPTVLGALGLVAAFRAESRDDGAVWFGTAATLVGLFLLYFTLGRGEWSDMQRLWPAFPALGGVAWLAAWLARPALVANLTMGLVALAVSVVGFLFTLGRLGKEQALRLVELWPALLIVVGVGMAIQYVVHRRD